MENIKIEDLKTGMQVRLKKEVDQALAGNMREYLGEIVTIRSLEKYRFNMVPTKAADREGWCWGFESIAEIICPESIHITRDGNTVHAVSEKGDKVVRRARADGHPDDTFDFATGAKLAFERVMEEDKHTEEEKRESLRLLEAAQMLFPEYTYVAQDDDGDVNVFDRKPYPSSVGEFWMSEGKERRLQGLMSWGLSMRMFMC